VSSVTRVMGGLYTAEQYLAARTMETGCRPTSGRRRVHCRGRSRSDPFETGERVRFTQRRVPDAPLTSALGLMLVGLLTGCLPYSMASTAATVAPGEVRVMGSMAVVGSAGKLRREGDVRLPMTDAEARSGIDERSDMGVRVTSGTGLVVSYKRRFIGTTGGAALAGQIEGGFVNLGLHALGGVSLVASSNESRSAAVYGGARLLAVAPLSAGAVRDTPTMGGFLGVRWGNKAFALLPEVGVFHDRPALGLGLRKSSWIVVPAISVSFAADGGRRVRLW